MRRFRGYLPETSMPRGRVAFPLTLSETERAQLRSLAQSRSLPAGLVRRARVILLSADGLANQVVAEQVRLTPAMVRHSRRRWRDHGLAGLYDAAALLRVAGPDRLRPVGGGRDGHERGLRSGNARALSAESDRVRPLPRRGEVRARSHRSPSRGRDESDRPRRRAGRDAGAPPRDQRGALAAAAEPAHPRARGPHPVAGSARRESAALGRVRAQGRPQGVVGLPLPWSRAAGVARLVRLGRAQSHSRVDRVRPETQTQAARHSRALPLSLAHRAPRRDEQQDQGHQTHGVRLPL
ncbi:MAG: helix-turn-helix domain-containing protein [Gemmatimonadaceae bacterium]|nr:helix-turn-helix domain-containing protein [Gemmatimonadaceae bacterium]